MGRLCSIVRYCALAPTHAEDAQVEPAFLVANLRMTAESLTVTVHDCL